MADKLRHSITNVGFDRHQRIFLRLPIPPLDQVNSAPPGSYRRNQAHSLAISASFHSIATMGGGGERGPGQFVTLTSRRSTPSLTTRQVSRRHMGRPRSDMPPWTGVGQLRKDH